MAPTTAEQQAAAPAEQVQDIDVERSLSGAKRKEMEKKKHSFKAIGNLVLAMRRFSNSLNPTYTYGKRPSSSGGGVSRPTSDEGEVSAPTSSGGKRLDRVVSGRPTSPEAEHGKYAYPTHGHKFDLLFKPLPPTEDDEVQGGAR